MDVDASSVDASAGVADAADRQRHRDVPRRPVRLLIVERGEEHVEPQLPRSAPARCRHRAESAPPPVPPGPVTWYRHEQNRSVAVDDARSAMSPRDPPQVGELLGVGAGERDVTEDGPSTAPSGRGSRGRIDGPARRPRSRRRRPDAVKSVGDVAAIPLEIGIETIDLGAESHRGVLAHRQVEDERRRAQQQIRNGATPSSR